MAQKMIAATLVSPGRTELREYLLPEISSDAGLLKMEMAGICGSDRLGYQRVDHGPRIMGHENVGVIAKVGREAAKRWNVQEGDRVAIEQYLPCGSCRWCRTGEFRFCDDTDWLSGRVILRYGNTPLSVAPGLWGGFGQYLYLHPRAIIHKVPSHVPAEQLALFVPMANGMQWAYLQGGAAPGKSIVIQGPGQMGLASVIAAREAGASCIIVSGLTQDQARFEMARELGAHHTVDVQKENLKDRVKELTNGHGADIIVNVSAGGKDTVLEGLQMASKISTIVLAGQGEQSIPSKGFGRKLMTMKWVQGSSYAAFELGLAAICSGKYPLQKLCTHQYPLSRVDDAMKTSGGQGEPGAIHVSINPWA